MLSPHLFNTKVLSRCKPDLQPLIQRLRNLFFDSCFDSCCYRRCVEPTSFVSMCREELARLAPAGQGGAPAAGSSPGPCASACLAPVRDTPGPLDAFMRTAGQAAGFNACSAAIGSAVGSWGPLRAGPRQPQGGLVQQRATASRRVVLRRATPSPLPLAPLPLARASRVPGHAPRLWL